MASPGQTRGQCGYLMAGFDTHTVCARCRDKKKGEDPCVKDKPCSHCELLTEDQKLRLATPVYQKKKEKRELKAKAEESSSTLVDPSLVSVIGLVKGTGGNSSEEVSTTPVGAKAKKIDKNSGTVTKTPGSSSKKPPESKEHKEKSTKKRHSSPARSSKVSTDSKLEAMDLKWSERFSRLEAISLNLHFNRWRSLQLNPHQLGRWTTQNLSLHRPRPRTDRTHLNRPLLHLSLLTDLLAPTSLQPTQLPDQQPPCLVLRLLTDIQIRIWTLTLLLIPNL